MPDMLDYMDAKDILLKHGIESVRSRYVKSAQEAVGFASGKRIVLKVISGKAIHKSKLGLVRADLSEKDIPSAFRELTKLGEKYSPYRILAQEMAQPGVEIIIGSRIDPQFGKIILVGLGGIYVEAFKDFALRICPIKKADAEDMIDQLRSKDVATYNGQAREMLVELIMKISKLVSNTEMEELDLNPVIVRKDGYDIVDIRLIR